MEKTERGRIQGLPKFMLCSQLSQERLKLWTSNLAGTFAGSLRAKGHKNFGDKGAWAYPGTAQFFAYPLLAQERLKLWTSNLAGTFAGVNPSKRPLKILETRGRGRSQGLSKIFKAAIYTAHHAVVFAIAQLSCRISGVKKLLGQTHPHWGVH